MPETTWFHGGPRVADWNAVTFDRDRTTEDLNAEGPGIYWTTDDKEASNYAGRDGVLYAGWMRFDFRPLPSRRPTLALLEDVYKTAAPTHQEIFLSNWGESPRAALKHYVREKSLHDALVTLYHDLFQYDAGAFVRSMRALRYDGVVIAKGTRQHLVLWNPRAMRIESSEPYERARSSDARQIEAVARSLARRGEARIGEVRAALPSVSREDFDQELIRLSQAGVLIIARDDDNAGLSALDRSGALILPSGAPRHVIRFRT